MMPHAASVMFMKKMTTGFALIFAGLALAISLPASEAPLQWKQQSSFDPEKPGLGLPSLRGVENTVIYAPAVSRAAVEEGGDGRYESTLHGTYNHHTDVVVVGDKVVVYWTNHSNDENGPGQRILARWGVLNETRDAIDWGDPAKRTIELVPAPVTVRRRLPLDPAPAERRSVVAKVDVVDGRLRVSGRILMWHGWTDDPAVRFPGDKPIPEKNYRPTPDDQNGYGKIFRYDMMWETGPAFRQLWSFENGELVPASPLYLEQEPATSLQLTQSHTWKFGPLSPAFAEASLLKNAPPSTQEQLLRPAAAKPATPQYAPGTAHLAADGKNSLAHRAVFRRPDGKYVIVRDNLIAPGHYYAAVQDDSGLYPPAMPTNLYGDVMPAAGEFPDGSVWLIGNSRGRRDFYLTIARDGVHFDHTWLLLHINDPWTPGYAKSRRGGPQYPQVEMIGKSLWVFYSIGKERIGVTRIPVAAIAVTMKKNGG